jgi:hypothetical protein
MPANLTPQYLEAERAFKQAVTPAEKIEALENMLAVIPKHKGTEKMIGELRRKLARLKSEQQGGHKAGGTRSAPVYFVTKEGAGQVALAGAPNTGKSALLRALTHAAPEVASYPFTTRAPLPGMMTFEDVQIQLVDLPPLDAEHGEAWVPQAVRAADAVLLVVDLSAVDLLDEVEACAAQLEKAKIALGSPASLPYGFVARPALVVANKADLPGAKEDFEVFRELLGGRFPSLAVSAESGDGLDELRRAVFDLLGLIRVYSKEPGKKPDLTRPFILKRGERVADLAGRVHKEILANLKHARVWSQSHAPGSVHHAGQMVHRDHLLVDRDIVELHT